MFDFRKIELSDKVWIKPILAASDFRGCEYNFANNLAWHRYYETVICRYKDFYISSSEKYGLSFTFPAGKGDYKELFTSLRKYAEEKNSPLRVSSVLPENLALFEELFSGEFTVETDEGGFDYVYKADKLRTLAGKKLHSKRNHLKRFYENNWSYAPMIEKDFDECIEYAVRTYNDNNSYTVESSVGEQFAINTFFNHFNELELRGGVIRVDGKVEGFTIGSITNSDTLDIHIEKATAEINGSYTAIMNEFAKSASEDVEYINREEDMGLEGLRKSKRSYYPEFQIIKNMVVFK
ncbi:MAG: DUF2156 domain-containing protein [Oscillospiraceae bacterium]|nr:DUF2156 domain-containing protein [Oscillospiraceae bacterium]